MKWIIATMTRDEGLGYPYYPCMRTNHIIHVSVNEQSTTGKQFYFAAENGVSKQWLSDKEAMALIEKWKEWNRGPK